MLESSAAPLEFDSFDFSTIKYLIAYLQTNYQPMARSIAYQYNNYSEKGDSSQSLGSSQIVPVDSAVLIGLFKGTDTVYFENEHAGERIFESKDRVQFIQVNSASEKNWFDYTLGTITILSALIAAYYTLKSIRKLYNESQEKQVQIDKLTGIVEKIDSQNNILEKHNLLIGQQVDVLSQFLIKSPDESNEINELARIQRQKIELENQPRLYFKGSHGFQTKHNYQIGNNGADLIINNITPLSDKIRIVNPIQTGGKTVRSGQSFEIIVEATDKNFKSVRAFIVRILLENVLGQKFEVLYDTRNSESLYSPKKIEIE